MPDEEAHGGSGKRRLIAVRHRGTGDEVSANLRSDHVGGPTWREPADRKALPCVAQDPVEGRFSHADRERMSSDGEMSVTLGEHDGVS